MIVQNDFLSKLKDFGLNSYESKLWTALLSRGVSTAGELSDIANVPRSRTYDVLESLEKKGFIVMKIGKPIKYLAVQPTEVIERVKKKVHDEAKVKVNMIDSIKNSEVLKELMLLHNQGLELVDPSEHSGIIKGRKNIYNHMESMIKSAEKSVVICTTEDGAKRKGDQFKKHLQKAKDRNVDISFLTAMTQNNLEHVAQLKKIGKVVDNKNSKARYCIVDEKEMLFMLMDDEAIHPNFEVGIWVNAPIFAKEVKNSTLNQYNN